MSELRTAIHELLWSLWSELGAPGGGRRHQRCAIDPEPLVVFTPCFAMDEPRLLGLVFDWCVLHGERLLKTRISGLANESSKPVRDALARFNGSLAVEGLDWSPRAKPLSLAVGRRSMPIPVDRPALLPFRVRGLVGGGVRADVLTRFLFADVHGLDVDALTPAGATRRSAERVVNELVESRHALALGSTRRRRFRLRHPESLAQALDVESLALPDWAAVLRFVDALLAVEGLGVESTASRRVEAVKARDALCKNAEQLGVPSPPDLVGRGDAFEALLGWGEERVRAFAQGEIPGRVLMSRQPFVSVAKDVGAGV